MPRRPVRDRAGPADVLVTTNTLNHVDDLRRSRRRRPSCLPPEAIVVEVPRATDLVAHNEIDTVYHEHLSQFSFRSLVEALRARRSRGHRRPESVDARRFDAGRGLAARARRRSPTVATYLEEERRAGLFEYLDLRRLPPADRGEPRPPRGAARRPAALPGRRIAGYGALRQRATPSSITAASDPRRSPSSLTAAPSSRAASRPGCACPSSPSKIESERIDVLLVLAWNVFAEIREQQAAFVARGGRFVVPIPVPAIAG